MSQKFTRDFHTILLVLCACTMLMLSGCAGYQLSADSPSVLGDGTKTLKIKEIDYPTLHPWLPHLLRSSLRDEINAKNLAVWVDSGPADYEIQLKVISFTAREWIQDAESFSLLFNVRMQVEAFVYQGSTNTVIWTSGPIAYDEHREDSNQAQAADVIVTEVMRRLTDRLRHSF